MKVKNGFLLFFAFVGLSLVSLAAWNKYENPKTYSVSLPIAEWEAKIRYIDNCQYIMKKSSLPSNVVSDWTDSLQTFRNEIVSQLSQIIKNEKDTISKKENKNR